MIDKSKLKELALAATPGPWECSPFNWVHISHSGKTYAVACCDTKSSSMRNASNNAPFIAAANPAAILELLAELDRVETAASDLIGNAAVIGDPRYNGASPAVDLGGLVKFELSAANGKRREYYLAADVHSLLATKAEQALHAPSAKQEPSIGELQYKDGDGKYLDTMGWGAERDGAGMSACVPIYHKGEVIALVVSDSANFDLEIEARCKMLTAGAPASDDDIQTLRERDYNADMADKLAAGIAEHFGQDIGEHSSGNCPWLRALDILNTKPEFAPCAGSVAAPSASASPAAPVAGSQQVPDDWRVLVERAADEIAWLHADRTEHDGTRHSLELGLRGLLAAAAPAVPVPAGQGWISVEDELPKFPRSVLVARHSDADGEPCLDPGVAMLYPDGKWRGIGVFYAMGKQPPYEMRETAMEVTHWMPLPAAPSLQQPKEGAGLSVMDGEGK